MIATMPKKKVEGAFDGLDDQIVDIVGQFVKRRKEAYEKAAIKLKNNLRDDVIRYTEMLDDRKISKEDYEFLVRGRYAQLKIELLEQVSLSKSKFDLVTEDVVKLLVKTGLNAVASV